MAHETPPYWDRGMRQRLQLGEAAALGELYDRFAPLAFGIALRALADEDDARRVTRAVFRRIWESPLDFDPDRGPMRSWIAAEAHRLAVDLLRSRDGGPEGAARSDEHVRAASTAARADYIVTAMPAPLRDALELARFQRHDYRRTAERLGITEAEARGRLRLGLQLLSSAAAYRADPPREGP
ncbi:RNA polymerase sigma factor [Streptomyces sp. PT12]|uniref:RNA polymerase sigma factor n=1 Tax=Streptomyces sp. PT12 TaxID=1510197 RepID=UPI000DE4F276|nr:sigma factor [Streptomyces sp. PT12]RBM21906.1 RNA polymerase [Streptomyces sp. PT12]